MGSTATLSCCPPSVVVEVERLKGHGISVNLVQNGTQCYAHVRSVRAPSPPWDKGAYDILIAIPLAAGGALDAFYLELPYTYERGTHRRISGGTISFNDRNWQLVSWHYPDGRPWAPGTDDLGSHIVHCEGFFFNRGAVNAIA